MVPIAVVALFEDVGRALLHLDDGVGDVAALVELEVPDGPRMGVDGRGVLARLGGGVVVAASRRVCNRLLGFVAAGLAQAAAGMAGEISGFIPIFAA